MITSKRNKTQGFEVELKVCSKATETRDRDVRGDRRVVVGGLQVNIGLSASLVSRFPRCVRFLVIL